MNPGGGGCNEPRSCHCTPVWVTEQDCLKKRKRKGRGTHRASVVLHSPQPVPCKLPFSPQAKPLFRSTQSLPTVDTSAQAAPQTYAEYAISQPLEGAGATCPTGSEPLAGETPNQALKPGAKSNSIIVSPRQVRRETEKWGLEVFSGKRCSRDDSSGRRSEFQPLGSHSFIHSFIHSTAVCGLRVPQLYLLGL